MTQPEGGTWEYLHIHVSTHDVGGSDAVVVAVDPVDLQPAAITEGMPLDRAWGILRQEGWDPYQWSGFAEYSADLLPSVPVEVASDTVYSLRRRIGQ
jgi:hypothetical protein